MASRCLRSRGVRFRAGGARAIHRNRAAHLRLEPLEDRRLLSSDALAALLGGAGVRPLGSPAETPAAVTLRVDPATGHALLVFDGYHTISGYEIASPSGQLVAGGWQDVTSHVYSAWEVLSRTPETLAEGGLTTTVTSSGTLDLGYVFTPGGQQDLTFIWVDASGSYTYEPAVTYAAIPVSDAVALQVNPATGAATLEFQGSQTFSGYEITSSSGQLTPGGWIDMTAQGHSGWDVLAATPQNLAEGSLSGAVTSSQPIGLGTIFTPGGTRDLGFTWLDPSGENSYASAVRYVGDPLATATSLAVTPTASYYGQPVTLSAQVSATGGTPDGWVYFSDGGAPLGAVLLDASGAATLTVSSAAVGAHSFTAAYGGTEGYAASQSTAVGHSVAPAATATTLVSSAPSAALGQPLSLSARVTVTQGQGSASGTVDFKDGQLLLGSAALGFDGTATLGGARLSVGVHQLTAVFRGDENFADSTSAALTQTITPTPTRVLIGSNPNPARVGEEVSFVVIVSGQYATGEAMTGSVRFLDGTTLLATVPLAGRAATFTTSTLAPGTHAITAVYQGDANYAPGTSRVLYQAVSKVAATVSCTVTPTASAFGQSVTLSATVSGQGTVPRGSVTFLDGTSSLGTVALDASGRASLVVSTLAVGSHSIVASYSGDATYAAASSAKVAASVVRASTQTTLASSANPAPAGQSVTFTATVTQQFAAALLPGGSVDFYDGATLVASKTLAAGKASYATASLGAGSHGIKAVYRGDGNYLGSTSPILTQLIGTRAATTTTLGVPASGVYGQRLVATATVSTALGIATGSVVFRDGTVALATAPLVGGKTGITLPALEVGAHSITAAYLGDSGHNPSTSPATTLVIARAPTRTTLDTSANPVLAGRAVTFAVSVAGLYATATPPSGTVDFMEGSRLLASRTLSGGAASWTTSSLSAGTHAITAVYRGDTRFLGGSSRVLNQQVTLVAATTTTLTASANPAVFAQPLTFTAQVRSSTGVPTGTVTFRDGAVVLGTASLNAQGTAAWTTSALAVGAHTISATYNGSSGYTGSRSADLIETIQKSATRTLISSSPNPAGVGDAVTFRVSVAGQYASNFAPGGTVDLLDGTRLLGSRTLDGQGAASFVTSTLAAGTHAITAAYRSDTRYAASTSRILAQTIQKLATSVAGRSDPNPVLAGDAAVLSAKVAAAAGIPTGAVTFLVDGASAGSAPLDGSGAATLSVSTLAVGAHSVVAVYGGDARYAAAKSPAFTLTVLPSQNANSVVLRVDPATGRAAMYFDGTAEISGYEIASASGQLIAAAWRDLTEHGYAGWERFSETATDLAEGNLLGTLAYQGALDLGTIFTPGGMRDVTFMWTDVTGSYTYHPVVEYAAVDYPEDVTLRIDPATGRTALLFDGRRSTGGYEITSASGQLIVAAWNDLASHGHPAWERLSATPTNLAEGSLTEALTCEGIYDLGNLFTVGGTRDVEFAWVDATGGYTFQPPVVYGPIHYAKDVTLRVDPATGIAQLSFDGRQTISGYEITSPGGRLLAGNWRSLGAQGYSGWETLAATPSNLAEGNLEDALSYDGRIDLGRIFAPGAAPDLTFTWADATGEATYRPAVEYESLQSAGDVVLRVDPASGRAALFFDGSHAISGYAILSASGQLLPGNWLDMTAHGYSDWGPFIATATNIAEGNLTGSLTYSGSLDLGAIFTPGGTRDLAFVWLDATGNHSYQPAVVYELQPLASKPVRAALSEASLAWVAETLQASSPAGGEKSSETRSREAVFAAWAAAA